MAELLIELFSEEIPARMQRQAAADLERLAKAHLTGEGVAFDTMTAHAGPRRLALQVTGLPLAQEDRTEERKGPRANAPEQALAGFLRSTGLTRDQLVERDGVLFAVIQKSGRQTADIIAEMVDGIVRGFPWPKSMRWGSGTLRWVRPLQRIICLLDGKVVPFEIDGIVSGDVTEGHRFMGDPAPFSVTNFADYRQKLLDHFVVLEQEERKARILDGARAACAARGLELVEDEGLLDEVSGLSEWPTPLLGDMDPAFLDLPPEVIRTSMRTHQKYFAVRRPGEAGLAPHFLTVANIVAADGGKAILGGNSRVLSARLNDARFFWDEDRKVSLDARLEKLKGVTFHAKLGTMYQRVERIEALARIIAPMVGADVDQTARAARLAKADLGTGMVAEFPELQGVMGGYYARAAGEGDVISDAVRDHYKPQGPGDAVPTAPATAAVALADKIDTLTGFFAIDEKPTGSKDPFALRRAALGVIRLVRDNNISVDLRSLIHAAFEVAQSTAVDLMWQLGDRKVDPLEAVASMAKFDFMNLGIVYKEDATNTQDKYLVRCANADHRRSVVASELLAFFADRLKVALRDEGKRHDLVDAVFALGDDNLVRVVDRVEALSRFLSTEDGKSLVAGYRRAVNILKAEEKKGPLPIGAPVALAGAPEAEAALLAALAEVTPAVEASVASEQFKSAMTALSRLRQPVDVFFEAVLVNDPDAEIRANRLRLLARIRDTAHLVADFSMIGG